MVLHTAKVKTFPTHRALKEMISSVNGFKLRPWSNTTQSCDEDKHGSQVSVMKVDEKIDTALMM